MSMNIKKGDKVVVLNTRRQKDKNGKPKTVTGKVLAVLPEKEQVIVEGYNMVSKHKKPKGRTEQGGIIKKEAPVHVSNVMVICPKCGQPTSCLLYTSISAISLGNLFVSIYHEPVSTQQEIGTSPLGFLKYQPASIHQ